MEKFQGPTMVEVTYGEEKKEKEKELQVSQRLGINWYKRLWLGWSSHFLLL